MSLLRFFPRARPIMPLPPDRETIELTGFSAEELEQARIVPQPDPGSASGYRLIVADSQNIDLAAFRRAGVEVRNGRIADIERVWSEYRQAGAAAGPQAHSKLKPLQPKPHDFSPKIIKTLGRLAADAARQGANEVFIGYPAADDFEFLGSAARFRGQIDSTLGATIARSLPEGEVYRATIEDPDNCAVSRLIIGCVRELNRPVVYLSWDNGREPDSSGQQQSSSSGPAVDGRDGRQVMMAFPRSPDAEAGDQTGVKNIVLVDDDIRYLTIVGSVLRRRGWIVHEALRAVTGLELIERLGSSVDLVIADVRMPEMNGIEFLSHLRSRLPDLPVLMLTSDGQEEVELSAVQAGASGFVPKQKELNILLAWICRLLAQPFIPAESQEFEVPPVQ